MPIHPTQLRQLSVLIADKVRQGRKRRYSTAKSFRHPAGFQVDAPPAAQSSALVPIHRKELHDETSLIPDRETPGFATLVTKMAARLGRRYDESRDGLLRGELTPTDEELLRAKLENQKADNAAAEKHIRRLEGQTRFSRDEAIATEARNRTERYRRDGKQADYTEVLAEVRAGR